MTDPLVAALAGVEERELAALVDELPAGARKALLDALPHPGFGIPESPLAQALELDDSYRPRPHLDYLAARLTQAVTDVENGLDRRVVISMPPRAGKSTLGSQYLPVWLLRRHPEWKVGMISHESTLAISWGRAVRRWADNRPELGIQIAADAKAVAEWETIAGGGILSRSVGGAITGRGFKALLLDDVVKDHVAAHSAVQRQAVWDWWTSTASTRLEPPSLVIVIGTRWHEDDFIGRLLSLEHDGDPDLWERIEFPAIAREADILGRAPGEPLISPLVEETAEQALARWETVRRSVGSYVWEALYQQRPAPASGAIFETSWWRYWTRDPARVSDNVVLFDPDSTAGTWVESWDCTFKGTDTSDFVVGQRWCRRGPDMFLTAQTRGRWTFTQTLDQMRKFSMPHVPARLVEDKANGTAVIDTMRRELDGLLPVSPRDPKEVRARAITPLIEAGNIYLPHPTEAAWVNELVTEAASFPTGSHDDQVDALTQAITRLRRSTGAVRHNPARSGRRIAARGTRHAAP